MKAGAFPADVLDRASLTDALDGVKARFGGIDVLEYSPAPHSPVPGFTMAASSEVTVENLQPQVEYSFYGAVAAAQAILPAMREADAGTRVRGLLRLSGTVRWRTVAGLCVTVRSCVFAYNIPHASQKTLQCPGRPAFGATARSALAEATGLRRAPSDSPTSSDLRPVVARRSITVPAVPKVNEPGPGSAGWSGRAPKCLRGFAR
ncbi:hypothetical protein ACFVYA_13480 [Amycolatopsis sp. NPDC058278]|uniref:hypothetical protein n=1 Tax=Amycolatopsis sp. NPDC058278 TaxID=3346417 RepID=UPI0036DCCA90